MRAGAFSQSFGDIERIECPSPNQWGQFIEVGKIQGAIERATSSLVGNYAANLASALFEMAKQRCSVDVQINFGACTDPRQNNIFLKKLIWQDVSLTSYSTDDLGALGSDENAKITETSDLSIGEQIEILQLTIQQRATDISTNQLVDAVVCDLRSCGDCDDPSPGCNKAFVLQGGQVGSPGTAPDILYTDDMGATWGLDEITAILGGVTADALACIGDDLVVVSNAAGGLAYKAKDDILDAVVGGWTLVTTGIVALKEPNDIWSVGVGAFVVGDGGYVYWVETPGDGFVVLDAGVATTEILAAVHALDEENAVAVGAAGVVIYTINGTTWSAATVVTGAPALTGVWMRSEDEWWVTTATGLVYYTLDAGVTWSAKTIPGAAITALHDIQFQEASIGYIAGVAGGVGALWRSYDGGYSWVRLPEGVGVLVGSSTVMTALAACTEDPNFIIAVGHTVASDGVLLVGID
jgi:photosystem II stability/assembly factor-like uncharacterized protein